MLRIKHAKRADGGELGQNPWVLQQNADFEEVERGDDLVRAADEVRDIG
jgi:hypothetical protein